VQKEILKLNEYSTVQHQNQVLTARVQQFFEAVDQLNWVDENASQMSLIAQKSEYPDFTNE